MGFIESIYAGIKSSSRTPEWRYKDLDTTGYDALAERHERKMKRRRK